MLSTWLICVFYSFLTGSCGTAVRQSWFNTITDTSTGTNFKPVAHNLELNPASSDDSASIRPNGHEWIRIMKRSDQHARREMVRLKGVWSWYPAFFFRLV